MKMPIVRLSFQYGIIIYFVNFIKIPISLSVPGVKSFSGMITFVPDGDFLCKWDAALVKVQQPVIYPEEDKNIPYQLGKFLSLFIPKKKNRIHFLKKHVEGYN